MSILDDLRKDIAAGNWTTNDLPSALAYNQALHEAGEALLNPTDEQVWAIVKAKFPPWAQSELEAALVRAVLAAAAGGER